MHRKSIPGDEHCIGNCFPVHFEGNLDKVLDKLDTEFVINVQQYRQFSKCSTKKITEEVYNFETRHHGRRRHVVICVRLTFLEISCYK